VSIAGVAQMANAAKRVQVEEALHQAQAALLVSALDDHADEKTHLALESKVEKLKKALKLTASSETQNGNHNPRLHFRPCVVSCSDLSFSFLIPLSLSR
jgi:hypothetical protein